MKLTIRFALCLAMLFAADGCSKKFMCNLNGTQCPAGTTPEASGGGGDEGGGEESAPDESAAESSDSSAEAPAEASGGSCKGVGQEVTSINDCCEGLDTETRGYLHNGGTQYCCERGNCHNTEE